jgi:hypothetical protein
MGLAVKKVLCRIVFGGNGSLKQRDIEKPRRGEHSGKSESIEPSRGPTTKLPTIWHIAECPRREWSPRERRDIDEARRASAWVVRESIEPR